MWLVVHCRKGFHYVVKANEQLIQILKEWGPNKIVDIDNAASRIALDTIGRAGFNKDFGATQNMNDTSINRAFELMTAGRSLSWLAAFLTHISVHFRLLLIHSMTMISEYLNLTDVIGNLDCNNSGRWHLLNIFYTSLLTWHVLTSLFEVLASSVKQGQSIKSQCVRDKVWHHALVQTCTSYLKSELCNAWPWKLKTSLLSSSVHLSGPYQNMLRYIGKLASTALESELVVHCSNVCRPDLIFFGSPFTVLPSEKSQSAYGHCCFSYKPEFYSGYRSLNCWNMITADSGCKCSSCL